MIATLFESIVLIWCKNVTVEYKNSSQPTGLHAHNSKKRHPCQSMSATINVTNWCHMWKIKDKKCPFSTSPKAICASQASAFQPSCAWCVVVTWWKGVFYFFNQLKKWVAYIVGCVVLRANVKNKNRWHRTSIFINPFSDIKKSPCCSTN